MYLGVDYYPEHWERERWDLDASLMEKAGIEVALNPFSVMVLEG